MADPAMNRVHGVAAMRLLLQQWIAEDFRLGYASETTFTLASWAFDHGVGEPFAVVRLRAADLDRAAPAVHHPPNYA